MKDCKICGEHKEIKKGRVCQQCLNEASTRKVRTKHGLVSRIISNQKSRVLAGRAPEITYEIEELREWLFSQELYHKLYAEWVESGYNKGFVPSVDRIDDYKGYTFDNIQLMSFSENAKKAVTDIKAGRNMKISKGFVQIGKDGNVINTFHSGQEASRVTGVDRGNITRCANGKSNTAGGFKWRHTNG